MLVHRREPVAALHATAPIDASAGPAVWWCDPTDAAIALGSRQSPDVVDAVACAAAGWRWCGAVRAGERC